MHVDFYFCYATVKNIFVIDRYMPFVNSDGTFKMDNFER